MNFEQELKELIAAALEAGIDHDTIIEAMEELANLLAAQDDAEDDDE